MAGQAITATSPRRSRRRLLTATASVAVIAGGLTLGAEWMEARPAPDPGAPETVVVTVDLPQVFNAEGSRATSVDARRQAELTRAEALDVATATSHMPSPAAQTTSGSLDGAEPHHAETLATDRALRYRPVAIERGDSLFTIFRAQGFPVRVLAELVDTGQWGERLNHLRPGESLRFGVNREGALVEVLLEQRDHLISFMRTDEDDFTVSRRPKPDEPLTAAPTSPDEASARRAASPESVDIALATKPAATPPPSTVRVETGDSFYLIFKRLGLGESQFAALLEDDMLRDELTRIHPGQRLEFHTDAQGELQRLVYEIEPERSLRVDRVGERFQSAYVETELERRVTNASGAITSSLFLAGQSAGLSDKLIMQMADIFGWDVDFALDIRGGDRFTVIYAELLKDGEKVKDGPILAAEFVNQGRVVRALRFQDEHGKVGYFTPDGMSMRKAFLRTPVKFSRISSGFDLNRLHPVLHTIRAHRGVDYAAPRGTPVKATGDGKVAFAGRKGGYGKTVILRHGGSYTTLYAHLHNLARGVRTGASVSQGQVIGYVGSTGLATGPHLHYEFRVNGVHKNPVTVELPKAMPIDDGYRLAFQEQTRGLLGQLDLLSRTQVAKAQ